MSNMQIKFIPIYCTVYTICKLLWHVSADM